MMDRPEETTQPTPTPLAVWRTFRQAPEERHFAPLYEATK